MKKALIIILAIILVLGFSIQYEASTNSINFLNANSFVWFIGLAFIYLVMQMAGNLKEKRLWICSSRYSIFTG